MRLCDRRLDRREFLRTTAIAGAAVAGGIGFAQETAAGDLPTRILGRTNARVTVLGLGTAPIGEGPPDTDEAERIFGEVMDRGVTYIDTARSYGNAEEALGRLVPARRDSLFLVTKAWAETAEQAGKSLTESLRQLKTDHVDLCHIHHIGGKSIDRVLAADGVLQYLLDQKEAGKLRFIGMSGHARPSNFVRMLETEQIDVVMCVMNYADRNTYAFDAKVLPKCREQNVGAVAMKAYAGIKGGFPNHRSAHVGCATPSERLPQALAWALDLEGVTAAVIGPYTVEQAIQNVEFARAYQPLTDEQRADLEAFGQQLAAQIGPRYGPTD